MPYQKRIPPVKVELSIEKFNLLVEMQRKNKKQKLILDFILMKPLKLYIC